MPTVIYTADGDDSVTYTRSSGVSTSYSSYTDTVTSYTVGSFDDSLGTEFLIDLDLFYIVDILGTRIILGGGYQEDGDDAVIYTVAL